MTETTRPEVWAEVLALAPLDVRRRASAYLRNIRKISEGEWLVWSSAGDQYKVSLTTDGRVTCSCPYSQQEKGYCKHICAVAAHELVKTKTLPWLRKLEELESIR